MKNIIIAITVLVVVAGVLILDANAMTNPNPMTGVAWKNKYYDYSSARLENTISTLRWNIQSTYKETTNKNKQYLVTYGTGSKKVVITAGQHGDEQAGVFVAESILYTSSDDTGFKTKYTAYVFPMMNPDGIFRASKPNALGQDVNRNWGTGKCPETNYALEKVDFSKVSLYMDIHGLGSGEQRGYAYVAAKDSNEGKRVCSIIKKETGLACDISSCAYDSGKSRAYLCAKYGITGILIEPSMANVTNNLQYMSDLGKKLKRVMMQI